MGQTTVGDYLVKRLEQAGVGHIFGVPGDYVLKFFDCLEASAIKVVTTCNELNAGYAADAYARVNGIGAACVTYGVGGFSIFNAAVGAFAERIPMIIISGAPRISEHRHRHLLHHTIGDMNLQFNIYEKITAASAILLSPDQAPQQIDDTIAACIRLKRPVYIEIPVDMVAKPCREPGPFKIDDVISSDKDTLDEAVSEAVSMLQSAKRPAILAGVEPHRLGCRKELQEAVDHSGYLFATTLLGKAVIPEEHPQFMGVYCGALFDESTRSAIEGSDALLCLGTLMTDITLGVGTGRLDPSRMITANSDKVRIKHHVYGRVGLKDFLNALCARLPKGKAQTTGFENSSKKLKKPFVPVPDQKISMKRLYERVNHFIDKDCIVITDTGDSLFCSAELFLPKGLEYIGQAFYLSIGYSVPGALGAGLAAKGRRPVVFVGDGAFQMTAQEVSTMIRRKLNPVIFLINNDGYTIERAINEGPYNDIQMWRYHRLPEVFGGGWGCQVKTEGELEAALKKAKDDPGTLAFIEVCVERWDCSEALKKIGKALAKEPMQKPEQK